jgi:hypothetical protein
MAKNKSKAPTPRQPKPKSTPATTGAEGDAPVRTKRKMYPHADFVTHFTQSTSIDEVAEKTGLSRSSVQARATMLRGAGVALPKMVPQRGQAIDLDELNAIVEENVPAE